MATSDRRHLVSVRLNRDTVILAEATSIGSVPSSPEEAVGKVGIGGTLTGVEVAKVGVMDALPVSEVLAVVTALSEALASALASVSPSKATVEFGLECGVESGKAVALLCQGSTKANLTITLTWEKGTSA